MSLTIYQGEVFGILGPNGSGKTTTLGIILEAISPDQGDFAWFGNQKGPEALRHIGSILETPLFYPFLHAVDNLKIIAEIKQVKQTRMDEILHQVGLYDRRFSAFRTYSLGMKQRLAVAAALIGDPEILILDEPTNGLDPQGIADIRGLIKTIAQQGKTIILASHLLDEVQKICSHVAVLQKGKCLMSGKVDELVHPGSKVSLHSRNLENTIVYLSKYEGINSVRLVENMIYAELNHGTEPADLNRYLFENGIILDHLSLERQSLENYFLHLVDTAL